MNSRFFMCELNNLLKSLYSICSIIELFLRIFLHATYLTCVVNQYFFLEINTNVKNNSILLTSLTTISVLHASTYNSSIHSKF